MNMNVHISSKESHGYYLHDAPDEATFTLDVPGDQLAEWFAAQRHYDRAQREITEATRAGLPPFDLATHDNLKLVGDSKQSFLDQFNKMNRPLEVGELIKPGDLLWFSHPVARRFHVDVITPFSTVGTTSQPVVGLPYSNELGPISRPRHHG